MLTGEGTTHRVNDIIVQPKTFGSEPTKPLCPAVQKDTKKNLTLDGDPLPVYVPGERTGPPNLQSVDLHSSEVTIKAHKKTLYGCLPDKYIQKINKNGVDRLQYCHHQKGPNR